MQDQHSTASTTKPILDGHVFARQQLFMALPKDLQEDTKHFRAFIEQDKQKLFQVHSHALVKSVYSVTGKELVDFIIRWLQAGNTPAHSTTHATAGQSHQGVLKGATAQGPAPTKGGTLSSATAPASSKACDVTEQLECAKQIAEALVLLGFLTPYTENTTHLSYIAPEHYVHDSELLIPIAPSVTDLDATSVWSVADGAVYARTLKRKAGLLGKLTDGKDVYVVFNDKTKKAYLFASDLAREAISELSGPTLNVECDDSHFAFGVRVSLRSGVETNTPETFNAETKEVQQEVLKAWLGLGATYKEGHGEKINSDSYGLTGESGRAAVLLGGNDQNKLVGTSMMTEPHDADVRAASPPGFSPASHSKTTPYAGSAAYDPTGAKHDHDHSVNANAAGHVTP